MITRKKEQNYSYEAAREMSEEEYAEEIERLKKKKALLRERRKLKVIIKG